MNLIDNLKNLMGGSITIHQELINKLIREKLAENSAIRKIDISIAEDFIGFAVEILAGENTPFNLNFDLSLGKYEFSRNNRFVELIMLGPIAVSGYGINIKVKISAEIDKVSAISAGAPEGFINMFDYLSIYEDRIVIDFNKMPGFRQALQNKLGFLLNNLEVAKLELKNEMVVINPSIKLY
jgi:hypothetical protein